MLPPICSKCQQPVRSGAHFCAVCGAPYAAPQSAQQPGVVDKMHQSAVHAGASAGPVVKDVAAKSWQVSRREMGRLAGILTLGGRAAYTEIASPQPALEGFVVSLPNPAWSPAVREPAAYLFLAALPAIWLLLLLQPSVGLLVWLGLLVALLVLAWYGARRPYFSRLSFRGLWQRIRRQSKPTAGLTFHVQRRDPAGASPVTVTMLGYDPQGALAGNTFVRIYGIFSTDGATLRAWKVLTIDNSGRLAGALTAPRLVPLVVSLFLPLLAVLPALLLHFFSR